VRGRLHKYRMRGESPSPGLLRNPTSPRKRGEVKPYPFSPCFAETVAGLPFVLTTRT